MTKTFQEKRASNWRGQSENRCCDCKFWRRLTEFGWSEIPLSKRPGRCRVQHYNTQPSGHCSTFEAVTHDAN